MFKKLQSNRIDEIISPEVAISLFRIGAAALILTHGIPKLIKVLNGDFSFADPIGIGQAPSLVLSAFAEAICAFFVLIGLWTRIALIPLIINMCVVFFIAHADDPFGRKELGLFYLISFVVLFFTGAGKFSLDRIFFKRPRRPRY